MVARKRIALIFSVNHQWMGGTYYVLNLIYTLGTLPDADRPVLILLCRSHDDFVHAQKYTEYPYLEERLLYAPSLRDKIVRVVNKAARILLGHNVMYNRSFNETVDAIYPVMNHYQIKSSSPVIYWIPDLQEKYLPHLFSSATLKFRDGQIKNMIHADAHIVFSSRDAEQSFLKFYPEGANIERSIYHFAAKFTPAGTRDSLTVLKKFGVSDRPFFYCANQFWAHKNHKVLVDAVAILKSRGVEVTVLCSGGTTDYRNPEYYPNLQKDIQQRGLSDNVRLLGLIERSDQLVLLEECLAVVQPSLFEGWSTSVEESKAMNKFMILSDIPLHKEQVSVNGKFFKRDSAHDLANVMESVFMDCPEIVRNNYMETIKAAASNFMKIILK